MNSIYLDLEERTGHHITWEDRSTHSVIPVSWMVTEPTPARTVFLATSTPRPLIPQIRTFASPILRIASWPRTYLSGQFRMTSYTNQLTQSISALAKIFASCTTANSVTNYCVQTLTQKLYHGPICIQAPNRYSVSTCLLFAIHLQYW